METFYHPDNRMHLICLALLEYAAYLISDGKRTDLRECAMVDMQNAGFDRSMHTLSNLHARAKKLISLVGIQKIIDMNEAIVPF